MEDEDVSSNQSDESDFITPTKEELKCIDDHDFISSDDSASEFNSSKPRRFNQLIPIANQTLKLLQSAKPKTPSIWKTFRLPSHSEDLINDSILNSSPYTEQVKEASLKKPKMANHKKRKYDEVSSSDDQERHHKKKIMKRKSHEVSKSVHRREKAHSLSSSDGENQPSTLKRKEDKELSSAGNHNGEVESGEERNSSFEQERVTSRVDKVSSKDKSQSNHEENPSGQSDCESDFPSGVQDSENESDQHVQGNNSISVKSNSILQIDNQGMRNITKEKKFRKRVFTPEDEEQISKLSVAFDERLSEENNIWVLHCPSDMDCSSLVNQRLRLGGTSQLTDSTSNYEAYSYPDHQNRSVVLAVPSHRNTLRLGKIPIAGNIIVEKLVEIENGSSFNLPEAPDTVEFPQNLRTRHPLLGLDYKQQPRTAPRVERRSKKKKHSKLYDEEVEAVPEVKKSKKRKRSMPTEELLDSSVQQEMPVELFEGNKSKRKKKRKNYELSNTF